MLSNAYFLAKFRFDSAENEPAKKNEPAIVRALEVRRRAREDGRREAEDERGGRIQGHAAESICHLFLMIPDL